MPERANANGRQRLKALLNEEASRRLRALGHTGRMADEAKRDLWWWLQARGEALSRRTGILEGRAIVWSRQGWAEFTPIEIPRAGSGEVTVKIDVSVVSPGTERAQYLKLPNARVGGLFRPGYSAAGTVLAVGAGVRGVAVGDRVAVRNVPHSSLATVEADRVYPVPDDVALDDAALVNLGIVSGQGVRLAALRPGERLCILGAGLVGALAQRLAIAAGAGPITMIATSRRREAVARAGGAADFLVVGEDDERIRALAAPAVIEATGDPAATAIATEAAGEGARVVLLGSARGITPELPLAALARKRLSLVGAHVETATYESRAAGEDVKGRLASELMGHLAAGRLTVRDLTPEAIDPSSAAAFYRRLATDPELIGARFDWRMVPEEERVRSGLLLRVPNLAGKGVDSNRRPLEPPRPSRRTASARTVDDPFAGAQGNLRIGLVGCGDIAVHNAAAISEAPNTTVTAAFDPVRGLAEDLAGSFGGVPCASAEELMSRDDVDVVMLSVPHHLHAPLALDAIDHARHVVVEKPPANNLSAAVKMVRAAEAAGVELSFCFPQRYDGAAQAAREMIERGAIGQFGGTIIHLLQDRSPAYWLGGFSGRSHSDWRTSRERAGGGTLIMNLCHYVDLVRWLVAVEVRAVTAVASAVDHRGEVEDTITVGVQFTNGAVGSFFGSTAVRGTLTSELRMWGSDGHVVVEPEPRAYTLGRVPGLRPSRWQSFGGAPVNTRAVYFSRLATRLAHGEPPEVTPQDGLAVQTLIAAAYRSVDEGRAIELDDVLSQVPA